MKHIFIINPKAGKGKASMLDMLSPQISEVCRKHDLSFELHVTSAPYEAISYIKERAMHEPNEQFRFYACGGDGTVYEVANGVYGLANAEFAILPLGSGNDFVRLFGGKQVFLELENQVLGKAVEIDVIDCGNGQIAVNQCSMGFDAETNAMQIKYKKNPLLTGETSYIAAMLNRFFSRMGEDFELELDGKPFDRGGKKLLLCAIGNSRWYGGGFMFAPRAIPDDGWLDCVIITMKKSKLSMLPFATAMRKGEHLDFEETSYIRCKKLRVVAKRDSSVNIDGEISSSTDAVFQIREKAIKFVLPLGHTYDEVRAKSLADEKAKPIALGV